ncbi:hypothetical protein evm_007004 [Chilo suppressalis]|nr:hypothetical protein evm_007004 [Chilo suppressalis]
MSDHSDCEKKCKKQTMKCIPCVTPNADMEKNTRKSSPEMEHKDHSTMDFPQKVDVKTCAKTEPPHPCDTPLPCDPNKVPEGDCFSPFLCFERLKNPEENQMTRCRPGASIGVRTCIKMPEPHPCDVKTLCENLPRPKKTLCHDPPLCKERIKNPEMPKVRRMMCTDSKGNVKEVALPID